MRFLQGSEAQRQDRLVTLLIVLVTLLIVLAAFVLLGDVLGVLGKFRQAVLMFLGGAILAYLMAPLVRVIQVGLRSRALSIAVSYLVLFAALVLLGVLLVNPFVSQARSLQSNLRSPAGSSLSSLQSLQRQAAALNRELTSQLNTVTVGQSVSPNDIRRTQTDISQFGVALAAVSSAPSRSGQTTIPPSYVKSISAELQHLRTDYSKWQTSTQLVDVSDISQATRDSMLLAQTTQSSLVKASGTPLLLLNLQLWLDRHGISIDLHDKFGSALQQVSSQLASIVNNAVTIALEAGTLLLNTLLILIISVYFLSDGKRFVRWCVSLAPAGADTQMEYFVASLNRILGAYLRTQILMALLAGALAAVGALIFGVPYAVVIFMTTFVLSLVPVIGPLLIPLPPILIAVVFTPLPGPVLYTIWILAAEQIITNIVGPRVQGHSVGIHPLEAMAAALVGFPIAGFLGAFFAVPAVAFIHVVVGSIAQARTEVRTARVTAAAQREAAAPPLVRATGER